MGGNVALPRISRFSRPFFFKFVKWSLKKKKDKGDEFAIIDDDSDILLGSTTLYRPLRNVRQRLATFSVPATVINNSSRRQFQTSRGFAIIRVSGQRSGLPRISVIAIFAVVASSPDLSFTYCHTFFICIFGER